MTEELKPGEVKVVARTKLLLNRGHLQVKPGQVVILGDEDRAQGVHVDLLLKAGAVVPYVSDEQAVALAEEGEEAGRQRRAYRDVMARRTRRQADE